MLDITSILNQMTLEEKINQLMQLATPFFHGSMDRGEITGPMKAMDVSESAIIQAGSVLGASGAEQTISIQREHLKRNRLGIPLLFMSDIVHGYKTIFPVPLALGCSWNLNLAEECAEIAAKEAAVSGTHVTFAPMVDLVRDPRWGRVMESTGEDAYLNSEFAKAQVKGFQGDHLKDDPYRVASCVKHFAAYGAAEGGRDYNTVDLSPRELMESYVPAFQAAIDAGCEMVMAAFNIVDGVPATANEPLLKQLLREQMGFGGVLISDWGAVKELLPHGVAEDEADAARLAMQAGIDIEMMTTCYSNHLPTKVKEGTVEEHQLDEAVLRILRLKEKLGLFENPYRGADIEKEKEFVLSEKHRETAYDAAVQSIVLLKNKRHLLPLDPKRSLALIGPFIDSTDILGPWSWKGSPEDTVSVHDGIGKHCESTRLVSAEGSHIEKTSSSLLEDALKKAAHADTILLGLGEASEMSGEAGSRTNIQIPEAQMLLFREIQKLGKPIVVVLFNGRPLDLTEIEAGADAILEAWFPGTEGGNAIGDILFGQANPSGKLTMSFPNSVGQVPLYYNHFNTGRPKDAPDAQERYASQYLDSPNEPLFPFGYGLSYTSYRYDNIKSSSGTLCSGESITFSIDVTNTGNMAGTEIVQLYIQDLVGEVVRPVKELKDFQRVSLLPGETKCVSFTITEKHLRYVHADLSRSSDPGEFKTFIGTSSRDVSEVSFRLKKDVKESLQ
ncbi:UNVERIFIED_CONTAM: glycoside hydrolase family 3 C-terminal domain-containing protein [Halobacillus marinus]|uniref:glycoside hydrolase family 3 N-terminal domain-containing protein n=1 Tax=Halobacillus sp. BAB-2008 TaxID=1246484 RepID=UPI002405C281|nr:glycoside hydrolase family 3 N-terminal domain-containing protein [Halobacillus sp. BAB-2008]